MEMEQAGQAYTTQQDQLHLLEQRLVSASAAAAAAAAAVANQANEVQLLQRQLDAATQPSARDGRHSSAGSLPPEKKQKTQGAAAEAGAIEAATAGAGPSGAESYRRSTTDSDITHSSTHSGLSEGETQAGGTKKRPSSRKELWAVKQKLDVSEAHAHALQVRP